MIQEKAVRKVKLLERIQDKEAKRNARERVAVGVLFGADSFDTPAVTSSSALKDAATQLRDSAGSAPRPAEQY